MDRLNWYFRQLVTSKELTEFENKIEEADNAIASDLLGTGILSGGGVVEDDPVSQTTVEVESTVAWDSLGRRINIQSQFADRISAIVRGLTLQNDGIFVPSTVGTYLLFNSAIVSPPFDFENEILKVEKSSFEGNNDSYEVQDVVTTTWGGLIPNQIMVRIDEELDEEGYTSGLAPTGTSATGRILSSDNATATVSLDEDNNNILPSMAGKERIVSLYARFDRLNFDERIDGNGDTIEFSSLESFKLVIDASTAEANTGLATAPALRTNGDIFLADIKHIFGSPILQAQIDTSRQYHIHTLPSLSDKVFEYFNAKFFGAKIIWTGTTLSTDGPITVTLPNATAVRTINTFSFSLANGEVLYVSIKRGVGSPPAATVVKTTRGNVPNSDDNYLVFELAGRVGSNIAGLIVGELEPGEEHTIGDNMSDDVYTYMGSAGETDNSPDYTNATGSAVTNNHLVDGDNLTKSLKKIDIALTAIENNVPKERYVLATSDGQTSFDFTATGLSWDADVTKNDIRVNIDGREQTLDISGLGPFQTNTNVRKTSGTIIELAAGIMTGQKVIVWKPGTAAGGGGGGGSTDLENILVDIQPQTPGGKKVGTISKPWEAVLLKDQADNNVWQFAINNGNIEVTLVGSL